MNVNKTTSLCLSSKETFLALFHKNERVASDVKLLLVLPTEKWLLQLKIAIYTIKDKNFNHEQYRNFNSISVIFF